MTSKKFMMSTNDLHLFNLNEHLITSNLLIHFLLNVKMFIKIISQLTYLVLEVI